MCASERACLSLRCSRNSLLWRVQAAELVASAACQSHMTIGIRNSSPSAQREAALLQHGVAEPEQPADDGLAATPQLVERIAPRTAADASPALFALAFANSAGISPGATAMPLLSDWIPSSVWAGSSPEGSDVSSPPLHGNALCEAEARHWQADAFLGPGPKWDDPSDPLAIAMRRRLLASGRT